MPDISMCSATDCSVARNCHRSPLSGTTSSDFRQSWFTHAPGMNERCPMYWQIGENSDENLLGVDKPLWRVVEYFMRYRRSLGVRASEPENTWAYLERAFIATIGKDVDYPPAAALLEWFSDSTPSDESAQHQILLVSMAVTSCLDAYHETPNYATKLSHLVDGELGVPLSQIAMGNGSVN